MKKAKPNPQGKGLAPLLDEIRNSTASQLLPAKQIHQVTAELLTSFFILKSQFSFRPVVGKPYWLYLVDGSFKLFMQGPEDWSSAHPGQYIGECVLQSDVTWTLKLDETAANSPELIALIEKENVQLTQSLADAETLDDAMPGYISQLPYYSRLLTFGLGNSLKRSMILSGINQLSYQEAQGLLTHDS